MAETKAIEERGHGHIVRFPLRRVIRTGAAAAAAAAAYFCRASMLDCPPGGSRRHSASYQRQRATPGIVYIIVILRRSIVNRMKLRYTPFERALLRCTTAFRLRLGIPGQDQRNKTNLIQKRY